jgi:hypothetical protein
VSEERAQIEANLLGPQRQQQLDQQFGEAKWARTAQPSHAVLPWERDKKGRPLVHPQRLIVPAEGGRSVDLQKMLNLDGLKAGSVKYIFVVTPVGALILGKTLRAPEIYKIGRRVPSLGHPTLTGGGPSRIAGELHYDHKKDEFFINDNSGRYNRHFSDRGPQQLENAAERLRAAGLPVSVRYGESY